MHTLFTILILTDELLIEIEIVVIISFISQIVTNDLGKDLSN